ncbi:hypothetical protein [Solirubrobacter pauli]|uniref:hypothetical protein n=1 Tax=Solirubrobacter pauli TaxID=166793 RepID=UPI0011C47775|nr:hypothetical protein [Solirubrobacter pauli]
MRALGADGFDVDGERTLRRNRTLGKSDGTDAPIAARKVLAIDGLAIPRTGGNRQALAAVLLVYRATGVGPRLRSPAARQRRAPLPQR